MNEEKQMESLLAEFLTASWIPEDELCARLGIGHDLLETCLHWEVIAPPTVSKEGTPLYHSETMDRLTRGLRLHRDLGVNWVGISIILDLMDQLETLDHRLQEGLKDEDLP